MQTALKVSQDLSAHAINPAWAVMMPNDLPALAAGTEASGDALRAALDRAATIIRAQETRILDLEKLSLTDELTGLTNRRGFLRAFERELTLTCRDTAQGGLLVTLDLDDFKQINDRWGHAAGDKYLRAAARALRDSVRATDIVARLGGDEFALLLTSIAPGDAATRLRRLEQSFAGHGVVLQDRVPLRASFGAAAYDGAHDADTVMRAADTRLYAHKARRKAAIVEPV